MKLKNWLESLKIQPEHYVIIGWMLSFFASAVSWDGAFEFTQRHLGISNVTQIELLFSSWYIYYLALTLAGLSSIGLIIVVIRIMAVRKKPIQS